MAATDLLKFFSAPDDRSVEQKFTAAFDEIDELRTALDNLTTGNDSNATGRDRDETLQQIRDFKGSGVRQLEVESSFRTRPAIRRFRRRLTDCVSQLANGNAAPADVEQGRATINLLRRELEDLCTTQLIATQGRRRLISVLSSLTAVSAVLGFGYRAYTGSQHGLETVSVSVAFPVAAQTPAPDGASWNRSSVPDEIDPFMDRFSRYYFGERSLEPEFLTPSTTSSVRAKSRPEPVSQRWKLVVSNRSTRRNEFISSVRVRLTCENRKGFPWEKLVHDPAVVAVRSDSRRMSLRNSGIGPALRVNWEVNSGPDWPLASGELAALTAPVDLDLGGKLHPNIATARALPPSGSTENESPRTLASPLYLRLDDTPAQADDGTRYVQDQNVWYEVISTVAALKSATPALLEEEYALVVRYETLSGQQRESRIQGTLPPELVYYRSKAELLTYLPGGGYNPQLGGLGPGYDGPGFGGVSHYSNSSGSGQSSSLASTALAGIVAATDDSPVNRKGTDVMVRSVLFEPRDFDTDRTLCREVSVDEYINPEGLICIYTELRQPPSGTYRVEVEINGRLVQEFRVECLVPKVWQLPQPGIAMFEELNRLQQLMAVEGRKPKTLWPQGNSQW